jgi:hypothetical protein
MYDQQNIKVSLYISWIMLVENCKIHYKNSILYIFAFVVNYLTS